MICVILGMHKSGTTMISQILEHSGISMGADSQKLDYDSGQQYERLSTQELNMRMLGCNQKTFSLDVFRPVKLNTIKESLINEVGELVSRLSSSKMGNWGFKDPRTCLSWGVWESQIPDCKLIGVWRDPREVLKHYVPNRPIYKQSPSRIFRAYKTLRAWYFHNDCMVKAIEKHEESLLFNYASFMKDRNSIDKLQAFLGVELRDLRADHMYRNKSSDTLLLK